MLKTDDLVKHLKTGKIKGAALDVLEYEDTSFEEIALSAQRSTLSEQGKEIPAAFQYLIKSKNVIFTPHIAGWTIESNYKLSFVLAEKIKKLTMIK